MLKTKMTIDFRINFIHNTEHIMLPIQKHSGAFLYREIMAFVRITRNPEIQSAAQYRAFSVKLGGTHTKHQALKCSAILCYLTLPLFYMNIHSFIHLVVCFTTGPNPLPKRALHIVRSRASSFK